MFHWEVRTSGFGGFVFDWEVRTSGFWAIGKSELVVEYAIGKSELDNWEVKTSGLPVEKALLSKGFSSFSPIGKSELDILGSQN